jgi:hypothetical protein
MATSGVYSEHNFKTRYLGRVKMCLGIRRREVANVKVKVALVQ